MSNIKKYPRNKENSKIKQIIIDRDLCITALSCIAVSDKTFKIDDENKAIVIDANAVDDATLISAVQSCPTQAIKLLDADNNEIQ